MLIHSQRLHVGILNEVLQALNATNNKGILNDEFLRHAIDEMRYRAPAACEHWKDLIAVALGSAGKGGSDLPRQGA